jgi:ATP-dependent Clp protease ATP-binding subunit ClpA
MQDTRLRKFAELMRGRVIGQSAAISQISEALLQAGDGQRPTGPLAVLLFAGGIGSGRTTTAKGMAEVLFGSEDACNSIELSGPLQPTVVKTLSHRPCVGLMKNVAEQSSEQQRSELVSILKKFRADSALAEGKAPAQLANSIFIVALDAALPLELTASQGDTREALQAWLQRQFHGKFNADFFKSFDAIVPFKRFDGAAKTRLAEQKIGEFVKRQTALGRRLMVDNSVAAYVGSRAKDELGVFDVQRAVDQYVGAPFAESVQKHEAAGKTANAVRIHVVGDAIRVSME